MNCAICDEHPMSVPCPGPAFRYDGGAGGVWTFCRPRMAEAIKAHDDDPTLDRSWMQDVEVSA